MSKKVLYIERWYGKIINCLNDEEKQFVNKTDILERFKSNANRYSNIRLLKTRLENAVYDELTEKFVF